MQPTRSGHICFSHTGSCLIHVRSFIYRRANFTNHGRGMPSKPIGYLCVCSNSHTRKARERRAGMPTIQSIWVRHARGEAPSEIATHKKVSVSTVKKHLIMRNFSPTLPVKQGKFSILNPCKSIIEGIRAKTIGTGRIALQRQVHRLHRQAGLRHRVFAKDSEPASTRKCVYGKSPSASDDPLSQLNVPRMKPAGWTLYPDFLAAALTTCSSASALWYSLYIIPPCS